jgi:hypothetical protein
LEKFKETPKRPPVRGVELAHPGIADPEDQQPPAPSTLEPINITLAEALLRGEVGYIIDAIVSDTPGVSFKVIEPIYNHGGNVLRLYGYRLLGKGNGEARGRIIVIAGFRRGAEGTLGGIREEDLGAILEAEIGRAEGVHSVVVEGPFYGPSIVVSERFGFLASASRVATERLILVRASSMQYIINTLYWAFPSTTRPLAIQALYMIGRYIGSYMQSVVRELLEEGEAPGRRGAGEEAGLLRFEEALKVFVAGGWARRVSVSPLDGGGKGYRVVLKGYWLEPPRKSPGSEEYQDPFTVGILEEIAESILGGIWKASLEKYVPPSGKSKLSGEDSEHVYVVWRV